MSEKRWKPGTSLVVSGGVELNKLPPFEVSTAPDREARSAPNRAIDPTTDDSRPPKKEPKVTFMVETTISFDIKSNKQQLDGENLLMCA